MMSFAPIEVLDVKFTLLSLTVPQPRKVESLLDGSVGILSVPIVWPFTIVLVV